MSIAQQLRYYEKRYGKLTFLNKIKFVFGYVIYERNKTKSCRVWRDFRKKCDNYDIKSMDVNDVIDIANAFEKCAKKDRYFTVQTSSRILYAFSDIELGTPNDIWDEILECLEEENMGPDKYVRMAGLLGRLWDMLDYDCEIKTIPKENDDWLVSYR